MSGDFSLARLRAFASHTRRSGQAPRLIAVAGALLVVSLMFASAGTFSNAAALERLAAEASELHRSNATAGAAGITRAAVSQAIVFEADRQLGVTTRADATSALAEARVALDEFRRLVDTDTDATIAYGAAADSVLERLDVGDVAGADRLRHDMLEPAYEELTAGLRSAQNAAELAILETQTSASRTAWVSRILTTMAIPTVAMTIYWWWTRRRVRDQRQQMQAWLEAERAVARAKDELIAGISHELRTPLTSIHGFAEILLEDGFDPTHAHDLLTIIHSESGELARMIEDLLTAARIDAGQLQVAPQATSLRENLDAVVEPFVRKGRDVVLSCPELSVFADPLRLRQVMRNLVSNAIRHGGENVAVMVESTPDHAVITVADDGPGVPDEIISRLFDRFVNGGRGAVLAGSVGLGLSVARDLATRMGGDISYLRLEGITMFELAVPLAAPPRPVLVRAS